MLCEPVTIGGSRDLYKILSHVIFYAKLCPVILYIPVYAKGSDSSIMPMANKKENILQRDQNYIKQFVHLFVQFYDSFCFSFYQFRFRNY